MWEKVTTTVFTILGLCCFIFMCILAKECLRKTWIKMFGSDLKKEQLHVTHRLPDFEMQNI